MKVLIIGLGSIAKKHIKALKTINHNAKIYAMRSNKDAEDFLDVINVFSWKDVPKDINFILISNPTSEHYNSIIESIKFNVPLFIEKPPLMDLDHIEEINYLIKNTNVQTYVGFNLRFHPVIMWLKENLMLDKVLEVQVYCGSYLPDWRPGKDYRKVYSAFKSLGGGAHLDLIHELDYIRWIFGDPDKMISIKGKKSNLEIDSFDYAIYNLEYKSYFISILLNYYRRDPKRSMEIVLKEQTWMIDLIKSSIKLANGNEIFVAKDYNLNDTYITQMRYFLENIYTNNPMMNNFEESIKTLKICLA